MMGSRSNFLKISTVAAAIAILALAGTLSGTNVQASQPDQATVASSTIAATAPGTSVATLAGTAVSTMVATLGGDEAYPPCPVLQTPTPAATTADTAVAAVASVATAVSTPSATTAATSESSSAAAPATATSAAAPVATTAPTAAGTPAPSTMKVGPFHSATGCTLTAKLAGDNEVPTKGDPKATGSATLTITRPASGLGEICFQIQVTGIALPATAAHIHAGPAGIAGDIVVPFAGPDESGKASGCTSGVDRSLIKAILLYPQNYYVNVHNTAFPAGAMRGQLTSAK